MKPNPVIDTQAQFILAADFPLNHHFPVMELLQAFNDLSRTRSDIHLILSGKRFPDTEYQIINFIELNNLTEQITYHPYFHHCDAPDFQDKRIQRISRTTDARTLSADFLATIVNGDHIDSGHNVLFFTAFHPAKYEGNSAAMRIWLDHLKKSGYTTHLLYYLTEKTLVSKKTRKDSRNNFDHYYEISVKNALTGKNTAPLNIDVDDWCGPELLEAVENICDTHEIHKCIVNYPFYSRIFCALPAYTQKILFTHDRFTDRNRALKAQGFKHPGWASLTRQGEKAACQRADIVVALQDQEAKYFQLLSSGQASVIEIPPALPKSYLQLRQFDGTLTIGYFGSNNSVNDQNLALFIQGWKNNHLLSTKSRIIIAGGVSKGLAQFIPDSELDALGIQRLGPVDDLESFFAKCNLVINPERGGSGIKIKTLETLAHGIPLLSTRQAMIGIYSRSKYHLSETIEALVCQTAELCAHPDRLTKLATNSRQVYDAFYQRAHAHLSSLLPPVKANRAINQQGNIVSIIIPFYNAETCLKDCLHSITRQTYSNLQVILIDDASTDDSGKIAATYTRQNPCFVLLSHENHQGLGPARHAGINAATGKYLFFMDSSDILNDSAIATYIDLTVQTATRLTTQTDTISGNIDDNNNNNSTQHPNPEFEVISGLDAMRRILVTQDTPLPAIRTSGIMIERQLFLESELTFKTEGSMDVAVVPFLYFSAGRICRLTASVFHDQNMESNHNRFACTHEDVVNAQHLWKLMEEQIQRFGLQEFRSNIATRFAINVTQNFYQNGYSPSAIKAAENLLATLTQVISYADPDLRLTYTENLKALFYLQKHDKQSFITYARIAGQKTLLDHYQQRLERTK